MTVTPRASRGRPGVWSALVASVLLALPLFALGVVPASADDIVEGTTEWVSIDAGESGGRELPSMSDDGRYVVYVGRGEGQGVWLTDRLTDSTTRLTTGSHFNPAISGDGQHVAYVVYGANRTVHVLDLATGLDEVVSKGDNGQVASGLSDFPTLSRDGRLVAFQSTDKLLDDDVTQPAAGGGPVRAYVRDRVTGDTEMVSVTDGGEASRGSGIRPDITPDGRYVAFAAEASNLLPPPPDAVTAAEEEEPTAAQQIYLRDRQLGTTELITVGIDDLPGDAISAINYGPTVSDDGRFVAYESLASNLVEGDTNLDVDAFVTDRDAGTTTRLSVDSNGEQVDLPNPVPATTAAGPDPTAVPDPEVGGGATVSGDGTMVAFESQAPLTPDDVNGTDTNWVKDIYGVELDGMVLSRLSVPAPGGTEATGTRTDGHTGETVPQSNGADPAVNADGRYVAFVSNGNLTGDRPVGEEGEEGTVSTEAAIFARTLSLPAVSVVSPDAVDVTRSDTLVVTGLNFTATPVVDLGPDISVTEVRFVTASELEVDVTIGYLAELGPRDVVVTNPGGDSATLADGFTVTADAVPNWWYLRAVYDDLLQRQPDLAGFTNWYDALEAGTARSVVTTTFVQSSEFRALLISGAYDRYLDRSVDGGGLNYWLSRMAGGLTFERFESEVLGSSEYFALAGGTNAAFVKALYLDVLDRTADSAGLSYWTSRLASGTSRTTVALAVVRSTESSGLRVDDAFHQLLDRAPDPGGRTYWVNYLSTTGSLPPFVALITASVEYFNRAETHLGG